MASLITAMLSFARCSAVKLVICDDDDVQAIGPPMTGEKQLPKHIDALEVALADVDNLLKKHPAAMNVAPGRPTSDEGPLIRASVLLTYAAWEVYVEDALIWAVERLVERLAPPELPDETRKFVADSQDDPWILAGEGWRKATLRAVNTRVRGGDQGSFGLNTAGPGQVINLYKSVLGAQPLNECSWPGRNVQGVKRHLAKLVEIRGNIAHSGQSPGSLHLKDARDWCKFVARLAKCHDQRLAQWVEQVAPEP
jgi:hypothetical protein